MRQVLLLFSFLLFASVACAQVTVNVSFTPSASVLTANERAQIETHVSEGGHRWAQAMAVTAPRSLEIAIAVASIPTANAASTTSAFVGVINGRNTFQQGVGHELLTGIDPNGAEVDGTITFGLDYLRNILWFDPDPVARTAPVPTDRVDAFSVVLHEFGHMIVYNGWADLATGQPPPSFWSTFDRWMQAASPVLFVSPGAIEVWGMAPDLTQNNLMHWGNASPIDFRYRASRAPIRWQNGVPLPQPACGLLHPMPAPLHDWDRRPEGEATLIDQLMNGVVYFFGRPYDIGALDRAVLIDTGLLAPVIFSDDFR